MRNTFPQLLTQLIPMLFPRLLPIPLPRLSRSAALLGVALLTFLPSAHAERIKIADWKLENKANFYAANSAVSEAVCQALADNEVDVAYLHQARNNSVFTCDGSGYGFLSAGTDVSTANGGSSLFIAYDTSRYTCVSDYPTFVGMTDRIAKAAALQDGDGTVTVFCVIAGAYLRTSDYATLWSSILPAAFREDYPGARVIYVWSTEVNNQTDRETTIVTWAEDTAGAPAIERARTLPLVLHATEVPTAVSVSTFTDSAAFHTASQVTDATLATLTFGSVQEKEYAVSLDVGSGCAAIGAEVVFTAYTQDVDTENATFSWAFGDGASATTPTNAIAHAYATTGAYTVSVSVIDGDMSAAVSDSGSFVVAAPHVYVAAGNANAAAPYATAETAAPDLPTAMAASADGTTVHVLDGIHEISNAIPLIHAIRVVGESGDPSLAIVTNTAAKAKVGEARWLFQLDHPGAFVANLTLTGGKVHEEQGRAAGVDIGASGGTVSNCVVSGCLATGTQGLSAGAFLHGGLLTHCVFTGNGVAGANLNPIYALGARVAGTGRVENCLFRDLTDAGTNANVVVVEGNGALVNCTIVDCRVSDKSDGSAPGASQAVRALASTATVRNVLVANVTESVSGDKRAFGGAYTNETVFAACASDLAEPVNEACHVATLAQLFRNHGAGDLRPGAAAANRGVVTASVPSVDLAGSPRIVGRAIDIGCYEAPNPCIVILMR